MTTTINKLSKFGALVSYFADPRKDIEVLGMFGAGNLGDEAMLTAANTSLSQARCMPWQRFPHRSWLDIATQKKTRQHLLVGGGTLIHGGHSGWLDHVEMRFNQGSKVSFFGTGIAFTDDQIAGCSDSYQRWSKILANSSEVHLRGEKSVEVCRRMGGEAKVFGDFAFLLHDADIQVVPEEKRRNTIGINVGNCLGNQENLEENFAKLVNWLSKDYHLVFHAVVLSDLEATQRVIDRAGLKERDYEIETHFFDAFSFMHSIRDYRAFIGLKLHAAGLAMIAGVPALMIAYLPKCVDFQSVFKHGDRAILNLPLELTMVLHEVEKLLSEPRKYQYVNEISNIAGHQRNTLEDAFGTGRT